MTSSTNHLGQAHPTPVRSRVRRWPGALLAVAGGVLIGLAPLSLHAQRATIPVETMIDSVRSDGSIVRVPTRAENKPFGLFAAEDFACAVFRNSGQLTGGAMNVRGPVPTNQGGGCIPGHIWGNRNGYVFFEMGLMMAAPPHEWRKIREVHPAARNMVGSPGFTAMWQFITSTPNRTSIDAADGQFGKNFAGVSIVFDGSCRDDRDFFQAGFSIMAMLDCPVTWGSEGYLGKLQVPDSVFQQRFAANPNSFNWDEFRIPAAQLNETAYLGTQSFYGYMSDYSRELRLSYGAVVPGGAGTPTAQGYPLGIELRLDGYQFANPAIRNTQFYQLTMVNKSAELYGTGVNYDSLYFGTNPGFLLGGQHIQSVYYDFPRNSAHVVRGGTSGRCSSTYPRRYIGQTAGCANTGGFASGVYTFTWLKSPLGDTRNKLFSDPESPFYAPAHPLAGDTITFNRAHFGAFGNNPIQISTRAAFGAMAKQELQTLDGRTPAELGAGAFLQWFAPEEYSGVLPDAAAAKYNKFVPGAQINPLTNQPFGQWDYDKDGVQDTISVPGCGVQGCHALWSDTNAGGYRNQYGNVFNTIAAGPFKLAAGDTTQFLWAFTWSPDSNEVELRINNLINAYFTNYEGPAAIAFPAINPATGYALSAAELIDSLLGAGVGGGTLGARIVIRLPQINPIDQYFLRQIAKIREDSINDVGRTRLILRLNPGLIDRLTDRANDNLAAVYIFKSCDGGTTWTTSGGATATCIRSDTRNVDNGQLSFAWRPRAIIEYNNGIPAQGTFTEDVQPGRSYVYSMVTRSRGFRDIQVIDTGSNGLFVNNVQNLFGLTQDTISSALATNGGSVINIYAPITNAAGRTFARVDTATLGGKATQDLQFSTIGSTVTGTSRLVYANRLIVRKTIDSITNAATTTVTAQYVIRRAVLSPGDAEVLDFVARSQTFSANENVPVRSGANPITGTLRGTSGSARIYVDTISAVNNSMGFVWVTSDNRPIFVTDNQYASNIERDQQISPLYPGFTVRSRDSASATTGFRQEFLQESGTTRDRRFVIKAPGDTMQAQARQFSLFTQNISGSVKRNHGGAYRITWKTDPWGPNAPFALDPTADLQADVTSSIEAAKALMTTVTTTDEAFAAQVGATASRPMVSVKVPFSMTYTDAETGATHPVTFAMLARTDFPNNSRLLGSGTDTVRVEIPEDVWMPGDTLYAIHKVRRDSTVEVGGNQVVVVAPETINGVTGFRPIQVEVDSVGLNKLVVSCTVGQLSGGVRPNAFEQGTCNPLEIRTRGATPAGGYLPVEAGWQEYFELTKTFDPRTEIALTALPFTTGNVVTKAQLSRVNVTPNPYIVRSDMDEINGRTANARIWFTGVPEQGVMRIYSVSGQWLQELTWTASDLTYQGNLTVTGDLPYNLTTREGVQLSSGLYLYVLTATGPNGRDQVQSGKFVIIR